MTSSPPTPPTARQEPFQHTEHGVPRPDPYAWLAETGDPEVLAHLAAERAFYAASVAHLNSLVATLQAEMTSRVPATERSAPWRRLRGSYYTEHVAGRDYPRLKREILQFETEEATDSVPSAPLTHANRAALAILLDANELLGDSGYLDLGAVLVSPDEQRLAYSVDATGDEVFRLRFRDVDTGADLDEEVPRTYYGGAWSADSAAYVYTVHDQANRPYQLWRHALGTDPADDDLLLEEPDERFELRLRQARSGGIVAWAESNTTTECWVLDPGDLSRAPRSAGGRRDGVKYRIEHRRLPDGGEDLLVVTDDDATELRLMVAPVPDDGGQDHTRWVEVRPEDPAERLERADAFAAGVVLSLRRDGGHRLRLLPHDDLGGTGRDVVSAYPGGETRLAFTPWYESPTVTVCDQADVRPPLWRSVALEGAREAELHRAEAPGFDPAAYLTEVRSFPSTGGAMVPATIIRHRDTPLDGTAPALVYGYGAYGYSEPPEWNAALPSLLDRGVVYVHAHIRGGGELGRGWYLDGKLDTKQHTFDDHIAVADGLARDGLVDPARIATRGLSAGGLLQGAVFSQRPDRWCAVVAEVPFVDVVTTMFDATTPLTIIEWEEWGDPRIREQFDWMLAYSPYENIPVAGGRPDLLVTGAVHDPRVMVREPAKWVAALRASDPAWSPRCLFRCEVGAGAHTGPSGRFGHLAYEAEVYAWLLDRWGLADG